MYSMVLVLSLLVSMMVFFFLMLTVLPSPNLLLLCFISMVLTSTYSFFLCVSDILPYMLFLVYVGGMLVLVVYLIMLSSNYLVKPVGMISLVLLFISLFLSYIYTSSGTMMSVACSNVPMEFTVLLVLGSFLTYIFVYICNIICVGGSSMNIGKTP